MSFCDHVLVAQPCPTLYDPTDCIPPGSSVHGILQARVLEWVAIPFSRWSFWPRDRTPRSPALQADSLPSESPGKPTRLGIFVPRSKNSGVGSPSLLQWTFPTQESNRGLLHCRRILNQLSYEGSPFWLLLPNGEKYTNILYILINHY